MKNRLRSFGIGLLLSSSIATAAVALAFSPPKTDTPLEALTRVANLSPFAKGAVSAALINNPSPDPREAGAIAAKAIEVAMGSDSSREFTVRYTEWKKDRHRELREAFGFAAKKAVALMTAIAIGLLGFVFLFFAGRLEKQARLSLSRVEESSDHSDEREKS